MRLLTFAPGDSYPKVAAAAAITRRFLRPPIAPTQCSGRRTPSRATCQNSIGEIHVPTDEYELNQHRASRRRTGSLSYYIALAFVGGLILNLMPCVLPVIGLKVMSFVEQSGKSRTHAFVLNVWFAAGIIAVFLLLGVLAATIGSLLGRPIRQARRSM